MGKSEKNLSIEVLRGVAVLLLIADHVIGSTPEGGMRIEYPSFWRYIYLHNSYIIIPLFTAISGWVYAIKGTNNLSFLNFARSKFLRLVLPAYAVGCVYYLVQQLTPGTNMSASLSDMWRILIFPYTYFWFLPSIFLVMIAMYFIDKYKLCQSFFSMLGLLIVAFVLRTLTNIELFYGIPNLFSFQGAFVLMPFFMLGVAINRFDVLLLSAKLKPIWYACAALSFALLQYTWFVDYGLRKTLFYYIAWEIFVSGVLILLLNTNLKSKFLVKIASYSYGIYLWHGFGTAAGRILLNRVGVTDEIAIFVFAFLLALTSSVVAIILLRKTKMTNFLLLGARWR